MRPPGWQPTLCCLLTFLGAPLLVNQPKGGLAADSFDECPFIPGLPQVGLGTGNPQVGKSEPTPTPTRWLTPVAGMGTHCTHFSTVFLWCVQNPQYPWVCPPPAFLQLRLGTSLPTGDLDLNLQVFHFLEAILGSMTFSATG